MSRVVSNGFLLAGLALLSLALFDYFRPADTPGVRVEAPEREVADATAGQPKTVAFPIHNPTRHMARIVGLVEC